jgi:predicted RNA binding protein YcfA (HicA-like mRNA interferase family)
MPKKISELKQMLQKAGFRSRTGKGSHSNWYHPLYEGRFMKSEVTDCEVRS